MQEYIKKILGSGNNTTLIISNDEMEDSGLLLEGVSETIKDQAKKLKGGFLSMFLGTLGASLLGNMLAGKRVMRVGEGTVRVGYGFKRSSPKDL